MSERDRIPTPEHFKKIAGKTISKIRAYERDERPDEIELEFTDGSLISFYVTDEFDDRFYPRYPDSRD